MSTFESKNAQAARNYFLATRFYFVLKGLLNGEEGCPAIPAGGGDDPAQEDGWYLFQNEGDADGFGPFDSEAAARRSAAVFDKNATIEKASELIESIMQAVGERYPIDCGQGVPHYKDYIENNLTPKDRFAVACGALNYQVCNGGFQQWIENGYGTNDTRAFLVKILEAQYLPQKRAAVGGVLRLLGTLKSIDERLTFEWVDDTDGADGIENAGFNEIESLKLDDQYYAINDDFIVEVAEILQSWEA